MGTIARFITLRADTRQNPSYPNGYFINIVIGAVATWPIKSCLILAVEAVGHKITTVEGLENAPVQRAFVENWRFQCGYCTSGFLMVCHALSNIHPHADDFVIEEWLQPNLCRCTGYDEIEHAVKSILVK